VNLSYCASSVHFYTMDCCAFLYIGGSTPFRAMALHDGASWLHSLHTSHYAGIFSTSDQLDAYSCINDNKQHSQDTNIHAIFGIRTQNFIKGTAAEPRLRPCGHWNRRTVVHTYTILF